MLYAAAVAGLVALFLWLHRTESAQERIDRVKMKVFLLGTIWIKSTDALPATLTSVAEFYEDDVNTRMAAILSLIEPAIMIFMGGFCGFRAGCPLPADFLAGGYHSLTAGAWTQDSGPAGFAR